jgi:glutamate-5-semialdehyde dehydrogenase
VEASLDRLGVCNRLNLLLVDRAAASLVPALLQALAERQLEARGTVEGALPLDRPLGYEWANDPERVATVTVALVADLDEAVHVANTETSGLAAGIVAEDEAAAERFLDGYRGTAAFWHASTRFTDGFELTGAPETGINVDWAPGPRGPVTYRDLWLRQYRVVGDGTQRR